MPSSSAQTRKIARANRAAEKARLKAERPGWRRKRVLLPAAAVLAVGAVAIGANGGGEKPTVSGHAATHSHEDTPAPEFPGQKDSDFPAAAGQVITSDQVDSTSSPLFVGKSLGTEATACTTITLVNHGTETVRYNPFDYKLQNPGGSIVDPTFSGTADMLTAGELVTGGTVSGDVCFSDPLVNPGTYVVFQDQLFSMNPGRLAWINER